VGAKVVLGDVKPSELASTDDNFTFVHTDVSEYVSVVALFATAYASYARIDHVISNAGLVEIGQLFATGDSDELIREPPSTAVLDVNLKGTIFVTRVAVHYLRRSLTQNESTQKDASIVLVSSVAGFGNWPGLFQYSASKHGVMGLFHSTKDFLYGTENIRVNVILPNMTGRVPRQRRTGLRYADTDVCRYSDGHWRHCRLQSQRSPYKRTETCRICIPPQSINEHNWRGTVCLWRKDLRDREEIGRCESAMVGERPL
jgi:NAD(P)-dependent dehydrogenase (short-subunit alcohol dehydrogenase family)